MFYRLPKSTLIGPHYERDGAEGKPFYFIDVHVQRARSSDLSRPQPLPNRFPFGSHQRLLSVKWMPSPAVETKFPPCYLIRTVLDGSPPGHWSNRCPNLGAGSASSREQVPWLQPSPLLGQRTSCTLWSTICWIENGDPVRCRINCTIGHHRSPSWKYGRGFSIIPQRSGARHQ